MKKILVTVGTSLLTNFQREKKPNQGTDHHALLQHIKDVGEQKACAETNSLSHLLERVEAKPNETKLLFFHSETLEGELCAGVLQSYYNDKGFSAEKQVVPSVVHGQHKLFQTQGLRNLVQNLAKHVRMAHQEGAEVHINATGGFKAEIAYATLVGLLFDTPVYYIHDTFKRLIQMPPAPISWDLSLLAEYDTLLDWLEKNDTCPLLEVKEFFQKEYHQDWDSDPSLTKIKLLLEEETTDGTALVALSPPGEAYYEAYKFLLEKKDGLAIYLAPEEQQNLEKMPPSQKEAYEQILRKLRHRELWANRAEPIENTGLLKYPSGHTNERVVFRYEKDGQQDAVWVHYLVRHSDHSYNELLDFLNNRSRRTRFKKRSEENPNTWYRWT